MALIEGCRHSLEISIPAEEVENETGRVAADVQKKAKLPGFRPGKAPLSIIRKQFAPDIRQKVLESLIPKYLEKQFTDENLNVVSRPDITDIYFHDGEPLKFTAQFEVAPDIELGEYKGVEVVYNDPVVTEEDIDKRIAELRESKAEYVNLDPRPVENGDHAVVSLQSLSGVDEPIKQDEMVIEIGGGDTVQDFTDNLMGMTPGDEKDFDVTYPEDFGSARVAGKTIHFHTVLKGLRRKELPELNDEFAQDLGDFRDIGELREAVRKAIFGQRQMEAQSEAKNKIIEKLVDTHDFPVPETYVERQIQNSVEQSVRAMSGRDVDLRELNLDWTKIKESQRPAAVRSVKASLLLTKISEREAIHPTRAEVDKEVERIARQQREPIAAVQKRFEKDGTTGRIAGRIQTEKTLNFLFEHARKSAEA